MTQPLDLSRSVLLVRTLHADGGPEAPGTWLREPQGDTGWYVIADPSGHRVLCYRVNTYTDRGLFACFGPTATLAGLEALADLALPAREAWRRRDEASVKLYLRSWTTLRCSGFERDSEGAAVPFTDGVRVLIDEGGRLPDWTTEALPWNLAADGSLTTQALARYRVTSFAGNDTMQLGATLAGMACPFLLDAEPDPGA